MNKFLKRFLLLFLPVFSALLFFACGGKPVETEPATDPESASEESTEAVTETETPDDGPVVIDVISPGETVDIVAPEIRSFMELARAAYTDDDYTFSRKATDGLGNLPKEVTFTWIFDENEDVSRATLLYSKNEDMSGSTRLLLLKLGKIAKKQKQNIKVYNLETGVRYYWQVEIETSAGAVKTTEVFHFDTEPGPRILKIDGVRNARDLGGWETTDGKEVLEGLVFRTAKPDNAEADGYQTMIYTLGVNTELDLRNPSSEEMASPLKGSARYVADPETGEVLESNYLLYANVAQSSYESFIVKNAHMTAASLRIFTHPDYYPILFHCAAGADRTGCLAFLLNALCGVSETDLVIDYELTPGRFRHGVYTDDYTYDFPAFINALHACPGDTLQEKAYNFCKDTAGLTAMEIYNIRAMLTGHSAVFVTPPVTPLRSADNTMTAEIDPRESGTVEAVLIDGAECSFSFSDHRLTFSATGSGLLRAVIRFTDGTEMPLDFIN